MSRSAVIALLCLLLAGIARAQCSTYSTSVYSNVYGVNVTVNGLSGTNLSSAMNTWNWGCNGGSGGSDWPMFGFDSTYRGALTVNYVPGHQATPTCVGGTQYCRGLWDPNSQSITIYEQAGDPANPTNWNNLTDNQRTNLLAHELGHALGLHDDSCFSGIMNVPVSETAGLNPDECTSADSASYVPYEGTQYEGCQSLQDCHMSPIVIDLAHNGIHLTSDTDGVLFDLDGDGIIDRVAWTAAGADEAFLWIDKNGNGVVDDGTELFGSAMAQNGFEALAAFDRRDSEDVLWGGNGDGVIDANDRIWSHLRLWIDANHDGVSQPDEIFTLAEKGVVAIDLAYKWSGRRDAHDNEFRYRAAVTIEEQGHRVTGEAYDIFFRVAR